MLGEVGRCAFVDFSSLRRIFYETNKACQIRLLFSDEHYIGEAWKALLDLIFDKDRRNILATSCDDDLFSSSGYI